MRRFGAECRITRQGKGWSRMTRFCLLAVAAASLCRAQPDITGLQVSLAPVSATPPPPSDVQGITAGTNLIEGGFNLYINGNFNSDSVTNVRWFNPTTNVIFDFPQYSSSTTQIVAFVPSILYSQPVASTQSVQITVTEYPSTVSPPAIFSINPALSAPAVLPPGTVGQGYAQPFFAGGTAPFTVNPVNGTVPPGLSVQANPSALFGAPNTAGLFTFVPTITDFWGNSLKPSIAIQINPPSLVIGTTALPSGVVGNSYAFTLSATGGVPPYSWSASGLPPGLSLNSLTGVIAGTPSGPVSSAVRVTVTDSRLVTASTTLSLNLTPSLPSLQIVTPSTLPAGVVGVRYVAAFGASGSDSVTFALAGGAVPGGLTFTSNGFLAGTPAVPGQFSFTVSVTDQNGNSASKAFTLLIQPAPLTLSGTVPPTAPLGSPLSISVTAAGGVPPYRYSIGGSLPPGTSFTNGVISGTPTVQGNYSFRITVSDSAGTVAGTDFSITVVPPVLALPGSALPDAQVGVSYSARVAATGGIPPITYSGSGLPDGLSLSTAGAISGTPVADGKFSFSVTATDSAGGKVTGSFSLTIAPARLVVSSTGLPDGAVNAAYSNGLNATGGVKPYTWTATGLPDGLSVAASGAVTGTPKTAGKFDVGVTVKDAAGTSASATLSVTIAPALAITSTSAPNGTVGISYSANLAAAGGVGPFTFSASGLPAGLSISAGGALSGTPATPGTVSVQVTVKDSTGASVSKTLQIVIGLPAAPPLNFVGITDTSPPAAQPRLKVSLGASFPVDVVVTLVLSLNPDVDPSVQFSSGGRTARIVIPAGALDGATDVGVQTGTVAGTIVITAQLQAMGLDVTPSPAPRRTIQVNPAPPVPVTVTATRNATGFNVVITGFVTSREITQVLYQFTGAAGGNLQTTQLTVSVDPLFSQWFAGSQSAAFGSQFTLTQPFTVQGSTAIVSVTVTMVNRVGSSPPVTVNLN